MLKLRNLAIPILHWCIKAGPMENNQYLPIKDHQGAGPYICSTEGQQIHFSESTPTHNHTEFEGMIWDKRPSHMTVDSVTYLQLHQKYSIKRK